jgi:hypothetical protein
MNASKTVDDEASEDLPLHLNYHSKIAQLVINNSSGISQSQSISTNLNYKLDCQKKSLVIDPPSDIDNESILRRMETEEEIPDSIFLKFPITKVKTHSLA